jgi:PAS domain S-box-containing protein
LTERVKELQTLYRLIELDDDIFLTAEAFYQAVAELLPMGWQHSGQAAARIVIDGREYDSGHFALSPWRQSAAIEVGREVRGMVEVCYLTEQAPADEGPFLTEERRLLDAVARKLGRTAERWRKTEALRVSEERLAHVLLATGDAVWDCDLARGWVSHNHRWCQLLGFTDRLLEHPVDIYFRLIHPDDRPWVEARIDSALAGSDRYDAEYRIRRVDGDYVWIADHGRVVERLPDGTPLRMIGAFSDITERKRSEELIRLQTDAMANMAEGVSLVGMDGTILYTNATFDALFGYQAGEMTGLHVSVCNASSGQDPVRTADAITGSLKATGHWSGELLNRRKDGGEFWTRASVSAFRHSVYGRVWIGVQSDITELRRLRIERDQAYRSLERLTSHAQDETEQLRRELAREVHDEIGATLTGIRMQIEGLRQNANCAPCRTGGLDRLLTLVDQAVTRSRSLCTRLRPPMLDDLGLVRTSRWYLSNWSRQTGIRASGRFDPRLDELPDAERTDLFRILQELLTNVARHSGATRATVTLAAKDDGLRLRIHDNGRGFTNEEGSGFGLQGVRERARRHGGKVAIDSSPAGSTVTVTIPGAP